MEKNSTTLIKGGMDFVIIFHNTSETAEKPIVPDREKRKKKKTNPGNYFEHFTKLDIQL